VIAMRSRLRLHWTTILHNITGLGHELDLKPL
jgi:hypothetical protein